MTKAKISEYDAVAANNTDVNGVNIAENCPPSGMNDMGREIMAALKRFQTGSDSDGVTVGGNLVVSGTVTAANTATLGNVDVNGGTIDGTTIGGATPAAATFTNLTANGNVVLGDAATDTVTVTADVASDLIPSVDGSFDLGASGAEWQDLFVDGTANIDSLVADTADINGGTIDNAVIGGSTAAAITGTTITANTSVVTDTVSEKTSAAGVTVDGVNLKDGGASFTAPIVVTEIIYPVASFSWNSALASPAAAFDASEGRLINAHRNMKRCLLLDNGTVNYFLNPTNSALKADGTASVLTGADGMVMVQIPKFYVRRQVAGTITTWSVADTELPGFELHPAFEKDGVEVDFRYYSAYDACALDVTTSTFISGLNRDNAVDNTPNVDVTASTGDKLASVSGIHPMVGLTRAQFRTIAANRGSGWRQLDWTLFSAVQVLYLTEYQTFFSQSRLGDGNVNGTYVTQTGDQNDSPNSPAGLTNSIGNASTNGSQASAGASPGTAFMSYRGIENFYGNVFNFADGCIVNPDGSVSANQARMWWTNNSADFSDSVKTSMTEIAVNLATGNDFAIALAATDYFFVATNVTGGSASTYITDRWTGSTLDDRVVLVSGSANSGAAAGAFVVSANVGSSSASRNFGGRLAF